MTNKIKPTAETYEINNRIFFRLFQLGNILQTKSTSNLGVTTVQWSVLGALSTEESKNGIHFGALVEYLMVSKQNLDGVLSRLERDDLVERKTGKHDRRSKLVFLTPTGREYWNRIETGIDAFYQESIAGFSVNERITLAYLFQKLHTNLKEMGDELLIAPLDPD
jgi:DNA-binding MarR family transcriptional regulator